MNIFLFFRYIIMHLHIKYIPLEIRRINTIGHYLKMVSINICEHQIQFVKCRVYIYCIHIQKTRGVKIVTRSDLFGSGRKLVSSQGRILGGIGSPVSDTTHSFSCIVNIYPCCPLKLLSLHFFH